jgi:phosphopentomutase
MVAQIAAQQQRFRVEEMAKICYKTRNETERSEGLGNRCSIRLSYGADGSFPRFSMGSGQSRTRKTRRGV